MVKVSYSCMGNVSQIIKKHNKRVTKINERSIAPCNCRDKNNCPMNGNCRVENVVYKCVVSTTEESKEHVYIGVAEGDWKQRYYNHTMSFRNQKRKNDKALSTFLWKLKKSTKETTKLTWSVLKVVPAYSNISKRCLLCLNEKLLIATYPDQKQLLNKRSELIAKCRHENKFFLINYKTND